MNQEDHVLQRSCPKIRFFFLDRCQPGSRACRAEAQGKILRFRDFFPLEMADNVLTILENLPEDDVGFGAKLGWKLQAALDHGFMMGRCKVASCFFGQVVVGMCWMWRFVVKVIRVVAL